MGARPGQSREDPVEIVWIARDFLAAHRLLRQVVREHAAGTLAFHRVRSLVGDDEGSVLYRLKELCHARFRPKKRADAGLGPEALFDLAVGSLFHEAMKLRENFYQQSAYGPKIHSLRRSQLPEAELLRSEFEKILAGAAERIEESLRESRTLLDQTAQLFRVLLRANAESGLLTRWVLEHMEEVTEALGVSPDEILCEIHGSAKRAWRRGAASYLGSGFFAEAAQALQRASAAPEAGEEGEETLLLRHYAEGMQAYLEGRYADVLDHLEAWFDPDPAACDPRRVAQAHSAVSRLGGLLEPDGDSPLAARAAALTGRLEREIPPA